MPPSIPPTAATDCAAAPIRALGYSAWRAAPHPPRAPLRPTLPPRGPPREQNYAEVGAETILLSHTEWQMHYVVVDLKARLA